jgi:hypothetical protein
MNPLPHTKITAVIAGQLWRGRVQNVEPDRQGDFVPVQVYKTRLRPQPNVHLDLAMREEGVTWIRGWRGVETPEIRALRASAALTSGSRKARSWG